MQRIGVTIDLIEFVKKNYNNNLIDVLQGLGFETVPEVRDFFVLEKNCILRCVKNPRKVRLANVLFGYSNHRHPAKSLYNESNSYILDAPNSQYLLDIQLLPCAPEKDSVDVEHNKKAKAILEAHAAVIDNDELLKEIDELRGHTL